MSLDPFHKLQWPQFRARAPWWGADLQTLRNSFMAPRPAFQDPGERLTLPLADDSGDALVGLLQRPSTPDRGAERPLVVLIHGLSGTEESAYMIASAVALLDAGYRVMRLNLRGAGPSRPLCRWQYHAGRTRDLRDALAALDPALREHGLLLVGYSLGGNMLLKFAAEYGRELPVLGVCSVSAPIDLYAASMRFLDPRNRVYHWNLLRNMKTESFAEGGHVSAEERVAIESAESILEFDERFVAPRNGYPDAAAYYADNMARRFLGEIRVPTLIVHAHDDPWIPADSYTSFRWSDNPHLLPLLPPGGGHVGFHGRGSELTFHDRCLLIAFAAFEQRPAL